MKLKARIWVDVPDCLDGYFVELIEVHKKLDFQLGCEWFPTIEICELWATRKGATIIEKF